MYRLIIMQIKLILFELPNLFSYEKFRTKTLFKVRHKVTQTWPICYWRKLNIQKDLLHSALLFLI